MQSRAEAMPAVVSTIQSGNRNSTEPGASASDHASAAIPATAMPAASLR